MSTYDRRVTPARPDLAAAHLKGRIAAERYSKGRVSHIACAHTALRAEPSDDATLETELLFGENFTIYDERDGWVWGQAALDSHVGYARAADFVPRASEPTHRVVVRATPLLPAPDAKRPAREILPLNSKVEVAAASARFVRLKGGLYVFSGHVAPLSQHQADWVLVAEGFLGVPYVWGGKTFAGLDCSGLVQTALEAGGIEAPRDTDLMEAALGHALPLDAKLRRGDLIFWKGHMGVMLDATGLLHANGFAMCVSIEPLATARRRIAADGLQVRAIKRLTGAET